ncbi:hypothetical protein LMH87_001863 [Akanthomyces muscarius]|uniref:Aminoglycoside phosphotransferase domain-containing protein n=1 Tax=Akanthomyces muscarius TaxID=2231603 RepID=A0A9W8Q567_AKAMU|nr:hypothetical protein LMH87_001863 [Akanthomyces muscarius]KAJ4147332.1 hypothetical protein LMH87_001863 [Akanthomyces muscarius]
MTYLYETPDPTIHGILLPQLDNNLEFDFGIFFMDDMDDVKVPETLRHRPPLPEIRDYGHGIELIVGSPQKLERKPFAALYQEYWQDNMDNDVDEELEFSSSYLLSRAPGRQVNLACHRTRWVVYKEGQFVSSNESVALRNAGQQGLPVPKVFCRERLYAAGGEDIYSIKMSYIAGQALTRIWVTLTHEERIDVFTQVRNMLLHLSIPDSAPKVIGSCDGLDIRDSRLAKTHFGPISPVTIRRDYLRKLNQKRHRVVFCHCDLSPDNIIVNEHMQVIGLLDWEDAGYYPEYWENFKFYSRPEMVNGWHEYGKYILPHIFDEEVKDFMEVRKYQLP